MLFTIAFSLFVLAWAVYIISFIRMFNKYKPKICDRCSKLVKDCNC
jgi:hypothetical protein